MELLSLMMTLFDSLAVSSQITSLLSSGEEEKDGKGREGRATATAAADSVLLLFQKVLSEGVGFDLFLFFLLLLFLLPFLDDDDDAGMGRRMSGDLGFINEADSCCSIVLPSSILLAFCKSETAVTTQGSS